MNRFRPMAATQAGGAGGKEKAGQRACERQLLRVEAIPSLHRAGLLMNVGQREEG